MTGGTTTVGEVMEWSLDLSHSPVDTTAFGDSWAEYIPSIRNATGSFSGHYDTGDAVQTNLTNSMLGGSALALRLYVTAAKYYNVPVAYLTGEGISISYDGKAEASFDFQVSGAVTLV